MNKVVSLEQSCAYLLERSARHRRAGRYDEAMALLTRAQSQFGTSGELEFERASVYEAMDCGEEAARCYLRVARTQSEKRALALFRLTLLALRRSDTERALSYFGRFAETDAGAVPKEEAYALYEELLSDQDEPAVGRSHDGRARTLEQRAVDRLREGKVFAAERALRHAIAFDACAQSYTLLACCALTRMDAKSAVQYARQAHSLAPARVQTLCVLAEALYLDGNEEEGKRTIVIAALRAKEPDDLLAVAMESAKHGDDALTLRLTRSLLRMEPFHTRAMRLRACALTNLGRLREASRLFGRLCGLLPEDTVSAYYYRLTRDGERPPERLTHGLEVPREEAVRRGLRIATELCVPVAEESAPSGEDDARTEEDGQKRDDERAAKESGLSAENGARAGDVDAPDAEDGEQAENPEDGEEDERELCRLCAWALRAPIAGEDMATAALMLLGKINTPAAREMLLDALTDPELSDTLKHSALQVIATAAGLKPYDVDIGGRLMRVAAGGVSRGEGGGESSAPLQCACDALSPDFPDAPARLMPLWIAYLNAYGPAEGRFADACAAALEYAYHLANGRQVSLREVARRYGVTERLSRVCLRRIRGAHAKGKRTDASGRDGAD